MSLYLVLVEVDTTLPTVHYCPLPGTGGSEKPSRRPSLSSLLRSLCCFPSANNINSPYPSHRTASQRQRTTADDLTVLFSPRTPWNSAAAR